MPDSASGRLPSIIAALGLAAALALAGYGAATDSLTVDEPSHLVAGYTALAFGDYRLSPDHPPLARMLLAMPLLGEGTVWRVGEGSENKRGPLPPAPISADGEGGEPNKTERHGPSGSPTGDPSASPPSDPASNPASPGEGEGGTASQTGSSPFPSAERGAGGRGPALTAEAWRSGDFFTLGRDFMESWNDGQEMARAGRRVAIGLLAVLLLLVWRSANRLFGAAGGAVALWVAAFDPTLLAHGHLATIDVPFTLVALATLLAADAWLARPGAGRLALLAACFAAAALTKFSFFALLPALLAMALAARAPWRRIAFGAAALAVVTYLAIWAAYGFRFSAAAGEDAAVATMHVLGDHGRPRPTTPAGAWEAVLHDPATGADRRGMAAPLLRFARDHRLLPEAYLYGAAYVAKKGLTRASYLRGSYTTGGFVTYFPWAFAIKTPLPTIALIVLGLGVLGVRAWRRRQQGEAPLSPFAWGAAVFAAVYLAALLSSALNLGVRHLLPLTPFLAIAVGAAWKRHGAAEPVVPPPDSDAGADPPIYGRTDVVILLAWLAGAAFVASPFFIGYFNEGIGGWRNGHRYLADSNIDWGQDLLRLEEHLRRDPPDAPLWIVQAGDPPMPRGLAKMEPRWLFGEGSHSPHPAPIAGGLYAISATELLGVYRPLARAETWRNPRWIERYEQLAGEAAVRRREPAAAAAAPDAFEALRRLRLISRLTQRKPDARVGTSLFLFRLSDAQVAEATAP
jgi:hypothetical protein